MDKRSWNILCWNVRGVNDKDKWESIRNKIEESNADLVCLQETKREVFDLRFIRNFTPKKFDCFDYCPSVGASGVSLYVGSPDSFQWLPLKRNVLPSDWWSALLTVWKFGRWLWFMGHVDNLLGIYLFNGCMTWSMMMMIFGFLLVTLISIGLLTIEIPLVVISMTL